MPQGQQVLLCGIFSKVPRGKFDFSFAVRGIGSLKVSVHHYKYQGEGAERKLIWIGSNGTDEEVMETDKWVEHTMKYSVPPEGTDRTSIVIKVLPGKNGQIDTYFDNLKALEVESEK